MANITTGRNLWIDTVQTVAAPAVDCYVLEVCWVSDAETGDDIAADDDFTVTDGGAKVMNSKRAEFAGDDYARQYPYPGRFYQGGIIVSEMDGGVCTITLANDNGWGG